VLAGDLEELELFKDLLLKADSHLDAMKRLPGTHIVSAGLDPLKLGSHKLEEKMLKAGVRVEHSRFEERVHGFLCLDAHYAHDAMELAAEKLSKALQ
jgi:acetyl esterase/lipase